MAAEKKDSVKATPEQVKYANLLFLFSWLGIFLMMVTYFIYITGILTPHIPLQEVPRHWSQGVSEFLETTGAPHGWSWLGYLNRGDYLNFLGLVLLGIITIICYLTLLPAYAKRKERIYFVVCLLEIIVLSVAASGVLGSGGH
jgi:hypothetical protein